jgi:hypothetical protein
MKTKAICILLFTLLLCVRLSAHNCICSISEFVQKAHIAAEAADLCSDCGHNKKCCSQSQDFEISTSNSQPAEFFTLDFAKQVAILPKATALPLREAIRSRCVNKAPPDLVCDTPVSLHQKILI